MTATDRNKWIRFEEKSHPNHYTKTKFWNVVEKDAGKTLGHVSWYGPWRCYAFAPTMDFETVYERRCLRDIADFCEEQTDAHRTAAKDKP